jgi:hypothetical protein
MRARANDERSNHHARTSHRDARRGGRIDEPTREAIRRDRCRDAMSYGATPDVRGGDARGNTIFHENSSFGRRREDDGVRVSPRALIGAIAVACAATLGAHEVGRSTGTKAGLGLCSCECHCDSNGGGEGAPALSVVRGRAANLPKTLLDQEVTDPMRCGALAAARNYSAWVHFDEHVEAAEKRNRCAFYDIFGPFAGDETDEHRVTGCSVPGMKPQDGCGSVRGWHRTASQAYAMGKGNAPSSNVCRQFAAQHGYEAWLWLSPAHSNPSLRNSCVFYSAFHSAHADEPGDVVHGTACTNPHASVANACRNHARHAQNEIEGWAHATHTYEEGFGHAKGPGDCKRYAKQHGYPSFLFINEKHPSAQHRFSCAYYHADGSGEVHPEWGPYTASTQIVNSGNDDIHILGCADDSKTPLEGCA